MSISSDFLLSLLTSENFFIVRSKLFDLCLNTDRQTDKRQTRRDQKHTGKKWISLIHAL